MAYPVAFILQKCHKCVCKSYFSYKYTCQSSSYQKGFRISPTPPKDKEVNQPRKNTEPFQSFNAVWSWIQPNRQIKSKNIVRNIHFCAYCMIKIMLNNLHAVLTSPVWLNVKSDGIFWARIHWRRCWVLKPATAVCNDIVSIHPLSNREHEFFFFFNVPKKKSFKKK